MTSSTEINPATALYSSDDHMDLSYVPTSLWQDRVASKWKDAAPKVLETSSGRSMWVREGRPWGAQGSKRSDGRLSLIHI